MKKSLYSLIILMTIVTITHNITHCLPPADQKKQAFNNAYADQLRKNIQLKKESDQKASTPAEKQKSKKELLHEMEETLTYFDSVKNFFGYGPLAEKRRARAEQQKAALEQKLFLEKKHFKTLHTDTDKQKSLKKQNKLANQIHTEKIALGEAWSSKQKALAAALAGATAYVGYQYGGDIVSAAKKWLGDGALKKFGEPTDEEMLRAYPSPIPTNIKPQEITPEVPAKITVETSNVTMSQTPPKITQIIDEPNWKYDFTNAEPTAKGWTESIYEASKGWGEWAQDQAYYFYNLLPSLRSTTKNE